MQLNVLDDLAEAMQALDGKKPSGPPRVPLGPRLDWSGPTPRLGFTKILQWGQGVGVLTWNVVY